MCHTPSRCEAARLLIRSARRPEDGYRAGQSKDSDAARQTPRTQQARRHGRQRCEAGSPPRTQQSRPRGRPARHAAEEIGDGRKRSEMGGRIGGRLGGVKREDGEARGGNGGEEPARHPTSHVSESRHGAPIHFGLVRYGLPALFSVAQMRPSASYRYWLAPSQVTSPAASYVGGSSGKPGAVVLVI